MKIHIFWTLRNNAVARRCSYFELRLPVISLRKHPFLLALRRRGRFARRNDVPPREMSPSAKSEEKRMFSQANLWWNQLIISNFSVSCPASAECRPSAGHIRLFIYLIIFWELSFHSRAPCIQVAYYVEPPIEEGGGWVGAAPMTPTGYIQFPYPAFF